MWTYACMYVSLAHDWQELHAPVRRQPSDPLADLLNLRGVNDVWCECLFGKPSDPLADLLNLRTQGTGRPNLNFNPNS